MWMGTRTFLSILCFKCTGFGPQTITTHHLWRRTCWWTSHALQLFLVLSAIPHLPMECIHHHHYRHQRRKQWLQLLPWKDRALLLHRLRDETARPKYFIPSMFSSQKSFDSILLLSRTRLKLRFYRGSEWIREHMCVQWLSKHGACSRSNGRCLRLSVYSLCGSYCT